jgi:hypothetical protein
MASTHTYGNITQEKIDKMINAMQSKGYVVQGSNPWNVDTHSHGVKLSGSWDTTNQVLSVTIVSKNFYVTDNAVWNKIDPLINNL